MRTPTLLLLALPLVLHAVGCSPAPTLRVATYNVALYGEATGDLAKRLRDPAEGDAKPEAARAAAAVIREVRPDVLLLQEIDADAVDVFLDDYLQPGEGGIDYPYVYVPDSNTGVPSGRDLDGDDTVGGPGDAFGWGDYPGQYGMALLSNRPIDRDGIVTLGDVLWRDLPDNRLPGDFYGDDAEVLRLSSKNHVRVPVILGDGEPLLVIAAHPTPPVFDGPEDRNGRRNADEIALIEWLIPKASLERPADPEQVGLKPGGKDVELDYGRFVILGDLNADPNDGESVDDALDVLLADPRVQPLTPTAGGGVAAATRDGQMNVIHSGDPAADTADFSDGSPGNLRVDYVLPGVDVKVKDSGVFWPADGPMADVAAAASDHRLVWADLVLK